MGVQVLVERAEGRQLTVQAGLEGGGRRGHEISFSTGAEAGAPGVRLRVAARKAAVSCGVANAITAVRSGPRASTAKAASKEIVRLLGRLFDRLGRRPTVDLDSLARLTAAVHEGSLAQSLVEPERLAPEELAVTYLPLLIDAVSEPSSPRDAAG